MQCVNERIKYQHITASDHTFHVRPSFPFLVVVFPDPQRVYTFGRTLHACTTMSTAQC